MLQNAINNSIVIFGPFHFPFGDASANRVYGIARAIAETGWHVFVVGKGDVRQEDQQLDGSFLVDGIQYDSIYKRNETNGKKALKLWSGGLSYQKVWERNGIVNPYAVISYSNYLLGNYWVKRTTSRTSTRFVVDIVEWYSPQEFKLGVLSLPYIDNWLGIRSYNRLSNAIVISKLLEHHFSNKVENIIRVPPIIDTRTIQPCRKREDKGLKLIYAGSPSRKDYLPLILSGLARLPAHQKKQLALHIYGVDYTQLRRLTNSGSDLEALSDVVHVHGRMPRYAVLKALQDSDFMVLLRPELRYANAGFSSKVPESLAVGTPVMLNYTSDLPMYIRDGHEGIIVSDCSAEAFATSIQHALSLSRDELNLMRLEARTCAEGNFDYRNYTEPLNKFLQTIK